MYDEGKEPRVRFEVDVSLTEILAAGEGDDLDSEQAVELAVIRKLMDRADPTRWSYSMAWTLLRQVLMASVPSRGDYADGMMGDDWDYQDLLVRYRVYADFLASDAESKMRDFDAVADLEDVNRMDAA